MLPWAEKLTAERTNNYSADDPEARCLPGGVPRAAPYHYQLVQTPKLLLMLFEGNIHSYRQIFLDRREHLKIAEPLWYGDSIGSWSGEGTETRWWWIRSGSMTSSGSIWPGIRTPRSFT